MNLFTKENFQKYSAFSSIKETKCYFMIKTKINISSNNQYKISIKIKKSNYKITVSSFIFHVKYHLMQKYNNKRHIGFVEKSYLFNIKRTEQDAFIMINNFFKGKEHRLEDFI